MRTPAHAHSWPYADERSRTHVATRAHVQVSTNGLVEPSGKLTLADWLIAMKANATKSIEATQKARSSGPSPCSHRHAASCIALLPDASARNQADAVPCSLVLSWAPRRDCVADARHVRPGDAAAGAQRQLQRQLSTAPSAHQRYTSAHYLRTGDEYKHVEDGGPKTVETVVFLRTR